MCLNRWVKCFKNSKNWKVFSEIGKTYYIQKKIRDKSYDYKTIIWNNDCLCYIYVKTPFRVNFLRILSQNIKGEFEDISNFYIND